MRCRRGAVLTCVESLHSGRGLTSVRLGNDDNVDAWLKVDETELFTARKDWRLVAL